MKSNLNISSPNIKALLMPVGMILIITVVFTVAVKVGFGKITEQKDELERNQKVENVLKEKERILSDLSGEMDKYANAITFAMPERYSGFSMISQIKMLALEKGLTITDLKGGTEALQGSVNSVDITFTVDGPMLTLLDYLKSFENVSPVSNIEKAKFSQSTGLTRADVVVRTYFGPYPTKLPPINDPLKDLTAAEKDSLAKILLLRTPIQVNLTPQQPGERLDPFN